MARIQGSSRIAMIDRPDGPRAAFLPKLVTTLREGYGPPQLRADLLAGLTVAIVALPLSMAIAIASGVEPARGLYTAIVGGFLVSALGGSRFQIGGPAGAFIVLVAATVAAHGIDGLILATMLSGLMLVAAGLLRLGTFVKFIPYPVTVGFTAGIAAIIFASQLEPLLGLTLAGPEPGPLLEKLPALWAALPTLSPATVALSAALDRGARRAEAAAAALAADADRGGRRVGRRLGARARRSRRSAPPSAASRRGFPAPALPELSLRRRSMAVLPNAFSFALLGAIESLLSAVVADGMTGRRHRSNTELVAQGDRQRRLGALRRLLRHRHHRAHRHQRARRGARAGGGDGASRLPAALRAGGGAARRLRAAGGAGGGAGGGRLGHGGEAGVPGAARRVAGRRGGALVTLGLTLFRDLTEAIVVGFALGAVLFIHRMAQAVEVGRRRRARPTGPRRAPTRRRWSTASGARCSSGRSRRSPRRSTASATRTGCW